MDPHDPCVQYDAPGFLLSRGTKLFSKSADKELLPLGTRYGDVPVLLQLRRDGPSLQRDLLREAAVGQPAMVAIIARLEKVGFIERRRHGVDRRASLIALSPAGKHVADAAMDALMRDNEDILHGFTKGERTMALNLLRRMIANMGGLAD